MLSHIEIWDVNDDLTVTRNSGTLMNDSDDHQFFTYDYGEIIRINHKQCGYGPTALPQLIGDNWIG